MNTLRIVCLSGLLVCGGAFGAFAQSTTSSQQPRSKDTNQSQQQSTSSERTTSQTSKSTTKSHTAQDKNWAKKSHEGGALSKSKVREVQSALKREGFDPGPVDGIMGPMTMTALRNYQSANRLKETGTVTPETESALMKTGPTGTSRTKPESGTMESQTPKPSTDQKQSQPSTDQTQPYHQEQPQQQEQPREEPRSGISTDSQTDKSDTLGTEVEREKSGPFESEQTQTGQTAPAAKGSEKHQDKSTSGKVDKDASDRAQKAAAVLQDLAATPDKGIPNSLLERAEAIAVIPHMMKGAFGIGGRYGKGLVSQRMNNGAWSAPSFIEVGGGSFGAQLGVSATDLVLVFTDRNALDLLEGGKDLKLGADASVAAGPVGRSAEAGVNAKLNTAVWAYSRTKGAFAGVALDGAVLSIDKDTNKKVYGISEAKTILSGQTAMNPTVRPFVDALDRTAPKKKISQK